MLAAAKTVFVVMIGWCTVADHDVCGIARGNTTYKTLAACTKVADALKKDDLIQIIAPSGTTGPWDAKAVCGTMKQAEQVQTMIKTWKGALQARPEVPEEPEHPGDRDPAPNGS